jgi:hypothetical protein
MRRVLITLFVLSALLVPAASGTAQEAAPGVLLIMDASGSMNQDIGGGVTLLDEAKAALREIVLRIPSGTEVGLRVYGHRASNDDRTAGCVDTELVIPVGQIDRAEVLAAIGEFDASGWTPIGLSLQEAVDDLGPGGGTVILVSDGIDTCAPPDPCEVAQQLADAGYVSHIHTVGLFLQDQAAIDQLTCIAEAGNGTFRDVGSVDGILDALVGAVEETVGGYDPDWLEGALDRNLAPVLQWAADDQGWKYVQANGNISTGQVRWYAVEVTEPSVQLAANFHIDWQPMAEPDEFIEVRIFDGGGVEIGLSHEVGGVVVEAPQRVLLLEAGDYVAHAQDQPWVMATTDPVTMFPSWEASEDFFQPTVERFHAAGLNGGIYEIFKRQTHPPPLEEGTYYIAALWDADRDATTSMQVSASMYPVSADEDDWREGRPQAPVRIDDGTTTPFALDPLRWSGDEIGGGLPEPTRAIEVWSAHDGSPEQYALDLTAGEVLVVGWDYWVPYSPETWTGDVFHQVALRGPTNPVSPIDFGEEFARLGFMETGYFQAMETGAHLLTVTSMGADIAAEPAYAIGVFVLPPEALQVLEAFGISGWDPGPDDRQDEWHEAAVRAVHEGLRAVAGHVEGR